MYRFHQFQREDQVEVCIDEEGFRGSYYTATVLTTVRVGRTPTHYLVRYHTLMVPDSDEGDEEQEPLKELVPAAQVRPVPPSPPAAATLGVSDAVDAFDNDGWWKGTVTGQRGPDCYAVFFDTTGDESVYPVSRLRPHQECVNGKYWVNAVASAAPVVPDADDGRGLILTR